MLRRAARALRAAPNDPLPRVRDRMCVVYDARAPWTLRLCHDAKRSWLPGRDLLNGTVQTRRRLTAAVCPPRVAVHRGYPNPSHVRQLIQAARHAGAAACGAGRSRCPTSLPAPVCGPPGCGDAVGPSRATSNARVARQSAAAAPVRWMPAMHAPQSFVLFHRQPNSVRPHGDRSPAVVGPGARRPFGQTDERRSDAVAKQHPSQRCAWCSVHPLPIPTTLVESSPLSQRLHHRRRLRIEAPAIDPRRRRRRSWTPPAAAAVSTCSAARRTARTAPRCR